MPNRTHMDLKMKLLYMRISITRFLLLFSLFCGLLCLLASCGSNGENGDTNAPETNPTQAETEPESEETEQDQDSEGIMTFIELTENENHAEETTEQAVESDAPVPEGGGTVELYQLAPENQSLLMSYVIVTPSRKVVVIDGGTDGYGKDSPSYLPSAIRAILGLGQKDCFEVEAWFFTHMHNDHYYELAKMLRRYKESDNFKINNIYFDFPDYGVEWKSKGGDNDFEKVNFDILEKGVDHYYETVGFAGIEGADIPESRWTAPDGSEGYYYDLINGAVINEEAVEKGLTICVDGVDFRILMTWWGGASTINNTSVIIRMEYQGSSVLFLGDCGEEEGKRLLEYRSAEEVKSDYIQLGHHGQGGPDQAFYDAIDARNAIRLWPTPEWVWNNAQTYAIGKTRSWMGLPYEATDFKKEKCFDTGKDFVAGCYKNYPKQSTKVESWTEKILSEQRVAVFGSP